MNEKTGKPLGKGGESKKEDWLENPLGHLYEKIFREELAWVKKNPESAARIFADDRLANLEREMEITIIPEEWDDIHAQLKPLSDKQTGTVFDSVKTSSLTTMGIAKDGPEPEMD